MNTKIYVENLAAGTRENDLMDLFTVYGNVMAITIIVDPNDRLRRCAFVTMVTPEGARTAIQALNGKTIGTDTLVVSEGSAEPAGQRNGKRTPRGPGPLF